jgi:enamine deaminase RidA (YjgF/YER057c/UK114 family)
MKFSDQILTDDSVIKNFDNNISASEYLLGENRFINIIVNQSTENLQTSFEKFINHLIDNGYKILSQFLFGNSFHENENKIIAKKYFEGLNWPVSVIKQDGNCWGTIITATKTNSLKTIYNNDIAIGSYFVDKHSEYCLLGGLIPTSKNIPRDLSTKSIFQLIDFELNKINMDFKNVARTWFYLDDLLGWYDDFNKVRNNYFTEQNIYNHMIPSSTGIGASNINSSILLSAVYVVKPKNDNVKVFPVLSPLQCPPSNYKSLFSRAVEIEHPDYKHLIISGTASINSDGRTKHVGNIYKQIELTMNVVESILRSRKMSWEDVTKGIVYFKDINDVYIFNNYCKTKIIPQMPLAMIQADICRHELLFEIEMDAVTINKIN